MSTRQKSFFDQDPKKPKFRGQWHRPRAAPAFPPPNHPAPLARHVTTGPPIMPSTQTRSKLKAFQFIEGAPAAESATEKENLVTSDTTAQHKETPRANRVKDIEGLIETPKLSQSRAFQIPSTPGTRLPLADLVGNVDDSSRHTVKPVASPEEQLFWRGSQPTTTPILRKQLKRARSSSPVGPSQDEHRLEGGRPELTTPQADPAMELWSRYTSNKGTPTAKKSVAFAHLINESSPRSAAAAGSVSGLRRWASCGVEFPASTRKRRRTQSSLQGIRDDDDDMFTAIPSSEGAMQGQPKSNLADMVQRMQESLSHSQGKTRSQSPAASSPLLQNQSHQISSGSPLQRHVPDEAGVMDTIPLESLAQKEDSLGLEDKFAEGSAEVNDSEAPKTSGSSDEFGDADFDDDLADALETKPLDTSPLNTGPLAALQVKGSIQGGAKKPLATSNLPMLPERDDDSGDEFGMDDDDDVFAADLEQAVSMYDTGSNDASAAGQVQEAGTGDKPAPPHVIDLVGDDSDDFGDDIDADEFAAAEVAATQVPDTTSQQDTRAIQRYLIKRVEEGAWTTERGYQLPEKVLLVEEEKTKLFKAITLRQAWYDTPCTPGSYVHVIGTFSAGQCIVDDHRNMLILHPDHLISATVVADSFGCLRRAVLQDRVKATSRANAPMLYGTLLHELFQEALKVNRWDSAFLDKTITKLLPSKYETILEINSTCEEVKEHMNSKLPELQSWANIFVRAEPRADAVVQERNGRQSTMSINKLLDVEEHVWSPMYGLKGNIDATVQVAMKDHLGERTLTVPFEIKTGKNTSSTAHIAQTALYNLLLSNRYDVEIAYGILYYLETSAVSRIPAVRNDIIHMIIKRNELACYVRDRIELPPMLKEDYKCGNCYAQEACFLYDKLVEGGDGERLNKKAKDKYDELVKSLKSSDQEFMKKWDTLLTKEESDMMKFRRELWTMLSTEREKLGRCFSNVILEPGSGHEENNGQRINRYNYTFIKQQSKPGFSFTESQLIIGEPIVVSDEEGHFALANGYVTNVRKHRITVAVDRRLHNSRNKLPGFDAERNQTFTGMMEVTKEGELPAQYEPEEEPVLYRLDKDEFSNGMAAARNNLIQIMDDNVYKARDLRALIVDSRAPVFTSTLGTNFLPASTQMSMNSDQKAAVSKVMSAKDYALVLGMPGTGKTTTIAHIIRTLVAKGKSVLLTSYTHTAVDNILLKIRNDKIGILRLGAAAKIHREVKEFATLAAEPKDSVEELEESWMKPPVVATTCLTINHPLFSRRVFDYCIVDEASQITLPVCLGPIRMSQKFILVGDHYQLPPLVQNKEAMEGGLDVSLFKLLCDAHPNAVVSLEHQYRMCAEIMHLSNKFIYSGRLKCGTEEVASRKLTLPSPTGLQTHHRHNPASERLCPGPDSPSCWLTRALSPSNPVVFINTDPISLTLEAQSGSRIINTLEANLVTHLTLSLLSLGIPASEIGIIAFYRSQLALLRSSLTAAHTQTQTSMLGGGGGGIAGAVAAGIELHTADKFQGRDKEVVLVSCVRSNDKSTVGDLLKDARRVNVALTRARSKLIILGSEATLASNPLLRDIVAEARAKGWVLDLGHADPDAHVFEDTPHASAKTIHKHIKTPNRSPCAKRKFMRELEGGNSSSPPGPRRPDTACCTTTTSNNSNTSPEAHSDKPHKKPKIFRAGMRVLEGRGVLKDVFHGAV